MRRYSLLVALVTLLLGWFVISPARGSDPPQTGSTTTTAATFGFSPAGAVLGVGEVITLTVEVAGVQDLGGFQFDLNYDPSVVKIEGMGLGNFLGSTGRNPGLLGPQIDHASGKAIMGGYSYAPPNTPGARGTGAVAWVRLRKVGAGTSQLTLNQTMLVNTQAQLQPSSGTTGLVAPRIAQVHLPLILKSFSP